jgi:predicted hotdog family 3-hydroxylacyl-ACP dehydratase
VAPSEKVNIPQKPPMVMVDRIISCEGNATVTALLVKEENVFCENGFLREPGLIENMAQTSAASAGMKPGAREGEPSLGFIGGIRNLKIHSLPRVGDEIKTRITLEHEVFDASVVRGEVFDGERLIAECELKIFLIKTT